ncbi:MAG: RimK family alpha-L-glutamate ligase [Deltaproteobacteria bacterium]|nr:RimK family alpha-L-glutamate ligase [Deltaproteobacteria bacterium]
MRIIILSRNADLYSTSRLVEAIRATGHAAIVVDTLGCVLSLAQGRPSIIYKGKPLRNFGCVVPRIGHSITSYGVAVVAQFEMMGAPVVNRATAISRSRNKLRALQFLAKHGLDIPRTVMLRDVKELDRAIAEVGGLPVILKLLQGTQGIGVILAETREAVASIVETVHGLERDILVQEYIREARGRDLRVIVVGGRAVAAMRRIGREGEFRSNIHLGGRGEKVELARGFSRIAIEAAKTLGLGVAGVDLLETPAGPKVMEVNSSPGLKEIERCTKIDVARQIAIYAVEFGSKRRESDPI